MSRPRMQSDPLPLLSEGGVIASRYRLEALLARGGMGAVWSATDLVLERLVAVKFMDPRVAASTELRARFEREAKAAAKLRTPHVVQVFDHGVEANTPYIVMELLEGEDLGTRLRRERRIGLDAAARIVTQAARALRRAHDAGILHRDLKPQNVYLARSDEDEIVKLLDFGIAKFSDTSEGESTRTGELLGSPHYMSPEQSRGLRAIDHRSDLWSLGVILYRAVTGRQPFTGEGVGDVIYRISAEPIPPPSTIAPDLPRALDGFFERALAREPADRFQSAVELAAAFVEASAGPGGAHAAAIGYLPDDAVATPAPGSMYPPTPVPGGTLTSASTSDASIARPVSPRVLMTLAMGVFGVIVVVGIVALRWRSGGDESAASERAPAAEQRAGDSTVPLVAPATAQTARAGEPPPEPAPAAPEPAPSVTTTAPPRASAASAPTSGRDARPAGAPGAPKNLATSAPARSASTAPSKKKADWGY